MKKLITLLLFITACGGDFYFLNKPKFRPDFTTKHGIDVKVGVHNAPSIEKIETWTEDTITFWRGVEDKRSCILLNVYNVSAVFHDEIYLVSGDKFWAGLQNGHFIRIAEGEGGTRGTFIHELSHVIAEYCFDAAGNGLGHALFKEMQLCEKLRFC